MKFGSTKGIRGRRIDTNALPLRFETNDASYMDSAFQGEIFVRFDARLLGNCSDRRLRRLENNLRHASSRRSATAHHRGAEAMSSLNFIRISIQPSIGFRSVSGPGGKSEN